MLENTEKNDNKTKRVSFSESTLQHLIGEDFLLFLSSKHFWNRTKCAQFKWVVNENLL